MILIALFLLRSEWEKLQLDIVRYRVPAKKPPAFGNGGNDREPKLRLLFISDLHDYRPARHCPEQLLEAIGKEKPDAVLIGGDMITVSKHRSHPVPDTKTALNLIESIAKEYPVYYGEGNHESRLRRRNSEAYAEYVSRLLAMGVRYLADNSTALAEDVTVSAVSLEENFYEPKPGFGLDMRLPENYLKEKLSGNRSGFQILLLHSPAFLQEAAEENIDLVLSGHMHGGTVRLPGGRGLMTPQYRLFVKECSGVFTKDRTTMIVNRGLGTHSFKFRFHNLPELSVIDIVPAKEDET